ncbi:LysR family transcriptional regulator [Roseomonas sp. BN140053]|uniref:LysR family transcriptional regulator n=1 Tax=Roseomonas sp. BN140053 TaxID=3391898 RepID=UPI0039E803E7
MSAKPQPGLDRARALEVFVAVAATGSFSAAGRTLGLTPSAVSRAVDRIEQRLGVRLVLRTTRHLALTAEGQAYLATARRVLADLDDAEGAIADQGAPQGRLRVSASLSHGRLCVVPLLGEFARRGRPEVPEALHGHDCLTFNFRRTDPIWPFREDGRDYALAIRGSMEANNGETLGQLALAGAGIARVGAFSVADDIAAGRLVPLLERYNPGDEETIHAVFVGGPNVPARVRTFVEFLAEQLR